MGKLTADRDMQNCFREYPEIYGAEIDSDDEEEGAVDLAQPETGAATDDAVASKDESPLLQSDADSAARDGSNKKKDHSLVPNAYRPDVEDNDPKTQKADEATEQVIREHKPESETDTLVPKESHDATADNKGKN